MRKSLLLALCFSIIFYANGQSQFTKVEPAFWWIGFNNPEVEVLFYHKDLNLSTYQPKVQSESVVIKRVIRTENPRYVFLDLEILATAKPGTVPITFSDGKKTISYQYELKERSKDKNRAQGFSSADVMYLIMPDRFANGDTKNDSLSGFFQGVHRDQPFGRHGGDLKGISDHLDYIKELGVTTIWLNPVLENNQKRESYHGYAITDLYKVDQRFGSNDDYLNFINKSHTLGLKVIQDMVMNHIGNWSWLVKDLPSKNWLHQFPTHTASNYRSTVIMDPYHSTLDEKIMSDGWFDTTMADVNQQDPLFAKYLIQNSIWWIEYAGIDGIRMDTYPYPDKNFMSQWCKELLTEYPRFNIVGEVWINDVAGTAYWQSGVKNADGYQSFLPSVTDFPLYFSMEKAFTEQAGWSNGLMRLHELLGRDFSYANPQTNVIFIDNHDTPRFFHTVGKDLNKLKMAWVFLLTTRGIPQLYYGTEILEDGDYSIHPTVRRDFPGGWTGDAVNAFTGIGITPAQHDASAYLKKLLSWRKQKEVVHTGKLRHYIPKDNVYVYFRYNEQGEVIMVVLNGNDKPMSVATDRFREAMGAKKSAKNPLTGEVLNNLNKIEVAPFTALILELE